MTREREREKRLTGLFIAGFEDFAVGSFADLRENFVHVDVAIVPLIFAHIIATLENPSRETNRSDREWVEGTYRGRRVGALLLGEEL